MCRDIVKIPSNVMLDILFGVDENTSRWELAERFCILQRVFAKVCFDDEFSLNNNISESYASTIIEMIEKENKEIE